MQEEHIYEYAVIRLVPRVEREEFFNIGLILYSKRAKYIRVAFHLCPHKFTTMHSQLDFEDISHNLESFQHIAHGDKSAGAMAKLDIGERFGWLTAMRSSVIQTSRPHPGKTKNLDQTFDRLFEELVR